MIAERKRSTGLALRLLIIVPVAAAFTHLATVLVRQSDVSASAFTRLSPQLPLNTFKILPIITPVSTPLPFLNPAFHYAICRFDSRDGPIALSARLVEAGWNLTIYDPYGTSLHASNGIPERPLELAVTIGPSEDRFFGLQLDQATSSGDAERPRIRVTANSGIAVLRAPDRGGAYTEEVRDQLKQSTCAPEIQRR